jgi:signal recognition particle GTPase
MATLNPQITEVEVGVKTLREVTIYPLSLADQGKMAKTLSTVFQRVMESLSHLSEAPEESDGLAGTFEQVAAQLSNIDIAESIVNIIQENLEAVLKLVVDDEEQISTEELTNEQFYRLVEIIYEVNYEKTTKNFLALIKRARNEIPEMESPAKKIVRRKVSHSKKPSPGFADGTITG